MSTFNISMFESIKDAINKEETKNTNNYADILSLKIGNTYTVRLLPFVKNPQKSFFHYYVHGWNSFATGKYVSAVSPTTFGERDPIAEERYRILRMGSEDEKEKVKAIRRAENWLVNVYVIEDPTNPENNGKVKVLRYGKQIDKIIKDAISGEYKDEYGAKIFDLGPNGVNFKIKVEKQSDYPSYTSSRFTTIGGDLKLGDSKQKEIYDAAVDLETVFKIKSQDELTQMINEHYHCKSTAVVAKSESLPEADSALAELTSKEEKVVASATSSADLTDSEIDDLLKDL
ncbi:MAG: hypothetical protein EBU90_28740 [Proteobacteria bacterium]|nr:hypothetical protein [Pseudomonadota bacterium]